MTGIKISIQNYYSNYTLIFLYTQYAVRLFYKKTCCVLYICISAGAARCGSADQVRARCDPARFCGSGARPVRPGAVHYAVIYTIICAEACELTQIRRAAMPVLVTICRFYIFRYKTEVPSGDLSWSFYTFSPDSIRSSIKNLRYPPLQCP